MSDPNTQPNQAPTVVPGEPGSTPAPAAAPPASAAATPAKPKAGNKPRPAAQGQAPKRKGIIEIPEAAFKARVQREAAAEVRRQTGVTMEEAVRLIKAGGTQTSGGTAAAVAGTADAALKQLREENDRLRRNNQRLTQESGQNQKKLERRLRAANDARVEAELRADARVAGITDPDYAVTLFARAVSADPSLNPEAFFQGLKTTHPVLFAAPAAPPAPAPKPVVSPTTAPKESPAAGEVRPAPSPAGAPPADVNAEEMSAPEFAAHQRRYGYVPGQA